MSRGVCLYAECGGEGIMSNAHRAEDTFVVQLGKGVNLWILPKFLCI